MAKSAEKLSSGYKINRAGDDAAGLAISEKMRSQIRGLTMAAKNSQDAISLVQTAEGALQETQNMLQRMNELAVQSATGTNQEIDRAALAKEFEQLKREINDVAEQTTFNNMKVLDGSLSYKGYERSAATAGVTVTRPTQLEGASASNAPLAGGTIATAADSTLASETPTSEISVDVKYTDSDGVEQTVTLTTTGLDNTNSDSIATLAGGTDAQKALLNLSSADGKWTGKINADGSIDLTATDATFDDSVAPEVSVTGTGLTTVTDAAGTLKTAAASAEEAAAAAANGTAGQGVIDASSWTSTGGSGGSTIDFTFTDADGNVGTITGVALGAADPITGAVAGLSGDVEMKDAQGNTVYTLTVTGQTGGTLDVEEKADADGKVTGADLTGLQMGAAADTGAGAALGNGNPAAVTIAGVGGDAATLKGVAPEEADAAASSGRAPSVTTVEYDFAKLQDGDQVTVKIGGQDIQVTKEASDTRDSFITKLQQEITQKLGTEASEGTVKVSGTAIVVQDSLEVGEPVLSVDSRANAQTTAMRIQVGALENEQLNISIDSMNTAGLGLDGFDLTTQDNAGKAITAVRNAINIVSDQRATLGAMQNRLEHKIANLNVSTENLSAAESRIRDVDMAQEMTNFTKNNILSQAATAMLAQANALPQNVLSLLG